MKLYPAVYMDKWGVAYTTYANMCETKNIFFLMPNMIDSDQFCYDRLKAFDSNMVFYSQNTYYMIKVPVWETREAAQSAIDNVVQDWYDAKELAKKMSSN